MLRPFHSATQRYLNQARSNWHPLGVSPALIAVSLAIAWGISPTQAAAQATPPSAGGESQVQLVMPPGPGQSTPPITITLKDALDRASKLDATYTAAVLDAKSAREDRVQARATLLPSVSGSMQYLGTQGNGGLISDGRFVTQDGTHVYRSWGVFHQDLSPGTFMATAYHRTTAAEALANAKAEVARRGLTVAVTKNFYALVVSQRKYATAQQAVEQARHFLEMTQDAERAGQAAHSDEVKADIQYTQLGQAFEEANLSMEEARLALAVMLFPQLNENFTAVDDLESAPPLPLFPEVQTMAGHENPDLRVALETLREANLDVKAAKTSFYPTLAVDTDYGIEANAFALRSIRASFPEVGPVPNLGYFVTAAMTIPVWDWGTLRSKLHQSEYRRQEAQALLSQTQRQMLNNLYSSYNEAAVARSAVDTLRHAADLAAESLRLINLRYQGGASTALDVVDGQNTLTAARNAYDDAQVRYRVALAALQTLTGTF